ncbi:MAG: hypothetical protein QOF07_2081 [Bradyrhizobium sp.]|nr:hypothetical protein [Bradyrhizobium sp.]
MRFVLSLIVAVTVLGAIRANSEDVALGVSLASVDSRVSVGSNRNDCPDRGWSTAAIKEGESESPETRAVIEGNRRRPRADRCYGPLDFSVLEDELLRLIFFRLSVASASSQKPTTRRHAHHGWANLDRTGVIAPIMLIIPMMIVARIDASLSPAKVCWPSGRLVGGWAHAWAWASGHDRNGSRPRSPAFADSCDATPSSKQARDQSLLSAGCGRSLTEGSHSAGPAHPHPLLLAVLMSVEPLLGRLFQHETCRLVAQRRRRLDPPDHVRIHGGLSRPNYRY